MAIGTAAVDDNDLNNIIVLTVFGASLVAVILGYAVARWSKREAFRAGVREWLPLSWVLLDF